MEAAGSSLAFLLARCFFGLFGVCLCASCSVDYGLFCGVGGRRFVAGVGWFGLGRWRVCVGRGDGFRGLQKRRARGRLSLNLTTGPATKRQKGKPSGRSPRLKKTKQKQKQKQKNKKRGCGEGGFCFKFCPVKKKRSCGPCSSRERASCNS